MIGSVAAIQRSSLHAWCIYLCSLLSTCLNMNWQVLTPAVCVPACRPTAWRSSPAQPQSMLGSLAAATGCTSSTACFRCCHCTTWTRAVWPVRCAARVPPWWPSTTPCSGLQAWLCGRCASGCLEELGACWCHVPQVSRQNHSSLAHHILFALVSYSCCA